MLRIDTWEHDLPDSSTTRGLATVPGHYFPHAGHSAATLTHLLEKHAVDYRMIYPTTAWTRDTRGAWDHASSSDAYTVLGWTTTPILRATLSRRLDSLNPVAAFRLLEQPEIAQIERFTRDYVVLRSPFGLGNDWPTELSGAISGPDVDVWLTPGPSDADGVVAVDVDTYLRRFFATEFAG